MWRADHACDLVIMGIGVLNSTCWDENRDQGEIFTLSVLCLTTLTHKRAITLWYTFLVNLQCLPLPSVVWASCEVPWLFWKWGKYMKAIVLSLPPILLFTVTEWFLDFTHLQENGFTIFFWCWGRCVNTTDKIQPYHCIVDKMICFFQVNAFFWQIPLKFQLLIVASFYACIFLPCFIVF